MLEELEVTDPAAVRVLTRGASARWLAPYFAGPSSITDAADHLGESLGRTHYWTRRLHDLGLLQVVETRPRAGRPVRLYRVVARRFVVPPAHLPEGHLERMVAGSHRVLAEALHRALVGEEPLALVVHQEAGQAGVSVSNTPTPSSPGQRPDRSSIHSSVHLSLEGEEAEELARELGAVLRRWSERCGGRTPATGRTDHVALVAMAPVPGSR